MRATLAVQAQEEAAVALLVATGRDDLVAVAAQRADALDEWDVSPVCDAVRSVLCDVEAGTL